MSKREEFVIPVAFDVIFNEAIEEPEAAERLVRFLGSRNLRPEGGIIDSWWTPNHPAADGSDREAVLLWVPMMSYAGRVTQGETPQQSVDEMFRTLKRWANE